MMLNVEYIETGSQLSDIRKFIVSFKRIITSLHISVTWQTTGCTGECNVYATPQHHPHGIRKPWFFNTKEESAKVVKQNNPYLFSNCFFIFSSANKKKLLLTPDGKPLGGQWTFDKENRKKYPAKKKARY